MAVQFEAISVARDRDEPEKVELLLAHGAQSTAT